MRVWCVFTAVAGLGGDSDRTFVVFTVQLGRGLLAMSLLLGEWCMILGWGRS